MDLKFAYCGNFINIYSDPDGENVLFNDFVIKTYNRSPKSGYGCLDCRLVKNLENMGVVAMRPVQIATLMALFYTPPSGISTSKDPDIAAISATGSGKTIGFLVPIIQKCIDRLHANPNSTKQTPLVLIFTRTQPLALMVYQVALKLVADIPVKVNLITGGQKNITHGYFDIGICTLGRFKHLILDDMGPRINLEQVKYFVVDEADEMIKTEDLGLIYDKIVEHGVRPVTSLLFSATVTHGFDAYYDFSNYYEFADGSINIVAPSVKQYFWPVSTTTQSKIYGTFEQRKVIAPYDDDELRNPFDALFFFLRSNFFEKGNRKCLIFVKYAPIADIIAQKLRVYGFNAKSIHGKQQYDYRNDLLKDFKIGKFRIAVSNGYLARGTDIDVDCVINYDLPTDFIEYVHRCGRTGRNYEKGISITFIDAHNTTDYNPICIQNIASNLPVTELPYFMETFAAKALFKKQQEEGARAALAASWELDENWEVSNNAQRLNRVIPSMEDFDKEFVDGDDDIYDDNDREFM